MPNLWLVSLQIKTYFFDKRNKKQTKCNISIHSMIVIRVIFIAYCGTIPFILYCFVHGSPWSRMRAYFGNIQKEILSNSFENINSYDKQNTNKMLILKWLPRCSCDLNRYCRRKCLKLNSRKVQKMTEIFRFSESAPCPLAIISRLRVNKTIF